MGVLGEESQGLGRNVTCIQAQPNGWVGRAGREGWPPRSPRDPTVQAPKQTKLTVGPDPTEKLVWNGLRVGDFSALVRPFLR